MTTIDGDLLDITSGVILHQTNCLGKTGGLAKALRLRFPKQFQVYHSSCAEHSANPGALLGRARCGYADGVAIVHCFGQLRTGRDRAHTNLEAVSKALAEAADGIKASAKLSGLRVHAPFLMGCGLGGGDWAAYQALLGKNFPDLTIVRHPTHVGLRSCPNPAASSWDVSLGDRF